MDDGEEEGQNKQEGGFQYVNRSRNGARRRRGCNKQVVVDDAEKKLARQIEIIIEKKAYLSNGEIGDKMARVIDNAFTKDDSTGERRELPGAILMLGLGSVAVSKASQMQLALVLLVQDTLQDDVKIEAFDPIFNADDQALLECFGIVVQSDNVQGKYHLDKSTFVYMPHCTKTIYENLLRSNWTEEGLERLWLCCNELERYTHFKKDNDRWQYCIDRIVPYLEVQSLPSLPIPHHTTLNDLAIQRFRSAKMESYGRLNKLPDESKESFWNLPEEAQFNTPDPELL